MKVLISGGTGFIGRNLSASLVQDGHEVLILSRSPSSLSVRPGVKAVHWDGRTPAGWGHLMNEVDAVVNLAGKSLSSWPWTRRTKREFLESRVFPGAALTEAVRLAKHRPGVFLQASGINHYGLRGLPADESTPPGDDFLARLTIDWEASSQPAEELGIRRVVTRSAVVLGKGEGLLPLMSLPVRLFLGGRLASGKQAMPWIHIADVVGAMRFLLEQDQLHGPFNLIAPQPTSSAEFMCSLAGALKRPYWFPTPAFLLRLVLGEMSVLITEGRYSEPKRLLEQGFHFNFPTIEDALGDLFVK
jgi:uncharacterized protein (TIGR01777 family)